MAASTSNLLFPEFTVFGRMPTMEEQGSDWALLFSQISDTEQQARDSLAQQPAGPSEAFAPPEPVLLPEFLVEPKPVTPAPVPVPAPGIVSTLASGLFLLLFPQSTGPKEFDEAGYLPPNVPPKPPGSTDPIEPPNWDDLSKGGDERLLDPKNPGLPFPDVEGDIFQPGEGPFFDVTPPKVRPSNPLLPGTAFDLITQPRIGDFPYGFPADAADPGPGSAPAPFGAPGIDPATGFPDLFPDLRGDPTTGPRRIASPDLLGDPLADLIGDPISDPFSPPSLPDPTRPRTGSPGGTEPGDFLDNRDDPSGLNDPLLTEFGPNPLKPEADTCQCEKKNKPRKPRKPRAVCYRGTYVQRAKTTVFKPTEQVPCDQPLERKKRAKKSRPGAFPGAGFMGSENLTPSDAADLVTDAFKQFYPIIDDYLKRKKAKPKKGSTKRNRKAKTKPGRLPGTIFTTPFPGD